MDTRQRRWWKMIRVPGGCLFWVLVSIILSVGLTVLVNLVLLLF